LEVAGTIVALGSGVTALAVGDEVCALVAGGGYAERVNVPQEQCLPLPRGLSMIEAAAIPETYFTVWTNVFERGALTRGESILIHGGTSGIGTTAIQLAHAFGAHVLTTAGSDEKCEATIRLGAAHAFNYQAIDWVAATKAATDGLGVQVVLDIVGGDYMARNLDALAIDGRLVQIAFLKSPKAEIDFSVMMRKRLWITGSTLRPRTPAQKGVIAQRLRQRVWPLLESRVVRPIIHQVFPLAQAADAHRLMEAGTHIGKIVLDTRA
jgi:NADPH2:quinone reductase